MHRIQCTIKDLVHQDRGRRGLKLERLYRELYDLDRYLLAYAKLYGNAGAMTPGVPQETVDGTSVEKMKLIIESLRDGSFDWKPAKRVYIPKKNGKQRPLGLPTWTDKLVQEVIRSVMEPYFEARFRDSSHGFRPDRGCHTALNDCKQKFKGANWFIEGDIKGCFDNIDHDVLVCILRESVEDERFLHLIRRMLQAGYVEDWTKHETLSGTPQGGVISPLLANVYLHKLDEFVENVLIPRYTRGEERKRNPEYVSVCNRMAKAKRKGNLEEWWELKKVQRTLPSLMPGDPNHRRLSYVRYADDFILAFSGPKAEAEDIRQQIKESLRDTLKLTLSEEKTLITHARTESARFLGYDLRIMHDDTQVANGRNPFAKFNARSINGKLKLEAPWEKIEAKCQEFRYGGRVGKRMDQMANDDFSIVAWFGIVFRGVAEYYCMAHDRARKLAKLKLVMQTSMLKTLAAKHKTSVSAMAAKYRVHLPTTEGMRTAYQVVIPREGKLPLVATFGGFSLGRQDKVINDHQSRNRNGRTEILERLLADKCEHCGATGDCQVHHVRKLAALRKRKDLPTWAKLMIIRSRKTLVLCKKCHSDLHAGRLD
jgi:group II intron reverse transcriptase/maturase